MTRRDTIVITHSLVEVRMCDHGLRCGIPCTSRVYDSILVIVDRLTKSTHFLPVRSTFSVKGLTHIYIQEIIQLYWVPISIISDCGSQFTSSFWRTFQ